jgi:phosphoheptose isomerase
LLPFISAASAGAFAATLAGRFTLKNHHAPPAITMSTPMSAAASGASPKRLLCGAGAAGVRDSVCFVGLGFAPTPTSSE